MYWLSLKKNCQTLIYLTENVFLNERPIGQRTQAQLLSWFLYICFSSFSLKKNPKLVREMWLWYIIRLELQKRKSAAWEKYIINLGNKLLIGIDYSDNNKCGLGLFFFTLDSIQFQIYFMSIQIYFCTSNHTILHEGSNFHSTCITNRLIPSVFGGAISSGPLNYNGS